MSQSDFAAALLDPDRDVPAGLQDPMGRPAPRRFAVYRNNVASGLADVLRAAFPAVASLVGEEFFRAMAVEFLRKHPPKTRILMLYGADFPAFLTEFTPVATLGYLPDVARLEQALRESYHAASPPAFDAATLLALQPDQLLRTRLLLQPAFRLLRSRWPVHAIWQAATASGPAPVMAAQDVAVLRNGFDPAPHLLAPGGWAFLDALANGADLGRAVDEAGEGFDLQSLFGLLLSSGAIVGIRE